ncbi:MAG: ribbon-helix-helix domain-containing protein [Prochlorococcaceae cyanobacterium]
MRASDLIGRKPSRVTATLPWRLVRRLEERASYEGRSLRNLIAHLLEAAG